MRINTTPFSTVWCTHKALKFKFNPRPIIMGKVRRGEVGNVWMFSRLCLCGVSSVSLMVDPTAFEIKTKNRVTSGNVSRAQHWHVSSLMRMSKLGGFGCNWVQNAIWYWEWIGLTSSNYSEISKKLDHDRFFIIL